MHIKPGYDRHQGLLYSSGFATTRESLAPSGGGPSSCHLRAMRSAARGWSELQRQADGHHGGPSGVDSLDDFAAVDALQVDGGDAEVAVSELALDDDERDAFAGHLDGVGVTELVRREPASHACRGG